MRNNIKRQKIDELAIIKLRGFMADHAITIEECSMLFGLNPRTLSTWLYRYTGVQPYAHKLVHFFNQLDANEQMRLIMEARHNVRENK